ncbi:MAG: biliverdin-producing heme oxygenase [Zavarzinella sp.]
MTVLAKLRAATGPIHQQIENLSFTQRMVAGAISKDEYLDLLQHLYHVHVAFEQHLDQLPVDFVHGNIQRSHRVWSDLQFHGVDQLLPVHEEINSWLVEMDQLATVSSAAWVGALYVFEGSRMGSRMLVGPLCQALQLPPEMGNGLDYHVENMHDRGQTFRQFMAALDNYPAKEEVATVIVEAAVKTFQLLYQLHLAMTEATVAV